MINTIHPFSLPSHYYWTEIRLETHHFWVIHSWSLYTYYETLVMAKLSWGMKIHPWVMKCLWLLTEHAIFALESTPSRPRLWKWYVDHTHCIFRKGNVDRLLYHLNSIHWTIDMDGKLADTGLNLSDVTLGLTSNTYEVGHTKVSLWLHQVHCATWTEPGRRGWQPHSVIHSDSTARAPREEDWWLSISGVARILAKGTLDHSV